MAAKTLLLAMTLLMTLALSEISACSFNRQMACVKSRWSRCRFCEVSGAFTCRCRTTSYHDLYRRTGPGGAAPVKPKPRPEFNIEQSMDWMLDLTRLMSRQ